MLDDYVNFYQMPKVKNPILICGFEGWSNAGNIAVKTVEHIIQGKGATLMAEIDPDPFYQFTRNRPIVEIKEGRYQGVNTKKASFYFLSNRKGRNDFIVLKAQEPDCRWFTFVQLLFNICKKFGISLILSIGGMNDEVLHTESVVSGIYSSEEWKDLLDKNNIQMIDYEGPSGIHSLIMGRAEKEGLPFLGLWGHSPLYLRGTNFSVTIRIIKLVSDLFEVSLDTLELENALKEFEQQIEGILEKNKDLQEHIDSIKRARKKGIKKRNKEKIIDISDFMRHREF